MNLAVNFKEVDTREEEIADYLIGEFVKESDGLIKNTPVSVTSVKVSVNGFVQAHYQDVKAFDRPSPNFRSDQVTPRMSWLKADAIALFDSFYCADVVPIHFRVRDVFDEKLSLRHINNCAAERESSDGMEMYDIQVWVYYNGRLWFHGWNTLGMNSFGVPSELELKQIVLDMLNSMSLAFATSSEDQD